MSNEDCIVSGVPSSLHTLGPSSRRQGDWICPQCQANVFSRNISCFRCQSPKPGSNARHGDWTCLNKGCGAHNYALRVQCFRCQVPKGSEKPGDWPCPQCYSNNFASRYECFRCYLPRPLFAHNPTTIVRPGDWLCPNIGCGSNVFANRDTCFRCQTPRPSNAEYASGSFHDMRPGDWRCHYCNAKCYAYRQNCFKCEAPKPMDMQGQIAFPDQFSAFSFQMGFPPYGTYFPPFLPTVAPHQQQVQPQQRAQPFVYRPREGDWTCTNCTEKNFARREHCFKCHGPRPTEIKQIEVSREELSKNSESMAETNDCDSVEEKESDQNVPSKCVCNVDETREIGRSCENCQGLPVAGC